MISKKWKGIVLHHSGSQDGAGCDLTTFRDWHRNGRGWKDVGYHLVVELLGGEYNVVQGRPLHMQGSHCKGLNSTHLGLCLAGNYTHDPPPEEQLLVAARTCAGLCATLGFDPSQITTHGHHATTACPGMLDLAEFRGMVRVFMRVPSFWVQGDMAAQAAVEEVA